MSLVAHRAFAFVPSERSFDGLTKRLLALRAEIDAILAELAGQAMAMPQGLAAIAAEPAASTLPVEAVAAVVDPDLPPVLSGPSTDSESKLESCGMAAEIEAASEPGADAIETAEPVEVEALETVAAATPEQPVALEQAEPEQDAGDRAEPVVDNPAPIAAIDTDAGEPAREACPVAELEIAPSADASAETCATDPVCAERQEVAAKPDAPQQPAAAVQIPVMPTVETHEALAGAAVVSLPVRKRKHKGELAAGAAMPSRSGRRLAAKIAACILVLLTAATVLVVADRTAFGSVQSLPWMSPTSSGPTGFDWLLQRLKAAAAQAWDEAGARSDLPLDDGPLSSRPAA